jgi:DNA-binding beta-propeller fold protein YncE
MDEDSLEENARVSVFDSQLRFIRAFGRGAKAFVANVMQKGQLSRLKDIAFSPDGKVYITAQNAENNVYVFDPF